MAADVAAQLIKYMLDLYNLGTNVLTSVLMEYAAKDPRVASAIKALGSAFNLLVGVTVFYIVLKLFSRFEKILVGLIVLGWAIFLLMVVGLMDPHTARRVAELIEKASAVIGGATTTTTPAP